MKIEKNIVIISVVVTFAVLFSLGFAYKFFREPSFDHLKTLAAMRSQTPDVFEKMRDDLPDTIKRGGIRGALNVAVEAFKQEAITIYQCHTFTHLVGHYSRIGDEENLKIITEFGSDFCEGGFKHGIESQIVLEGGPDFRDKLYKFCELLRVKTSSGCFHGAGHTFMRQTLDATKAIALCNTLQSDPFSDVSDCYNGIFSEYTNLAGGVDGETGLLYSEGPIIVLKSNPMEICESFPEKVQIQCALELNGYGISESSRLEDIERALRRCNEGPYKIELKKACMSSVSAVGAQHELPGKSTLIFQPFVLTISPELRKSYIEGAATEMKQFILNGVMKDWQLFCNNFPDSDDRALCFGIFADQALPDPGSQNIFDMFPKDGASPDEIGAWHEYINGISTESPVLNITDCKPQPMVIRLKNNQNLQIKNSNNHPHNIYHGPKDNPELYIEVPAESQKHFKLDFLNQGIFGYKCDDQRVGIFFVISN